MVRQLTAIMFTDMVGYTALMQEDEHQARLNRDRQREVLERFISEHGGRYLCWQCHYPHAPEGR